MMNTSWMMGRAVPEVSDSNKALAEEYWMYGASVSDLAAAWGEAEALAQLKTCGNCMYFDNSTYTLKALNADAGQGACTKFNFLCSSEAACQAWCSAVPTVGLDSV
jgi:hypothetical protein